MTIADSSMGTGPAIPLRVREFFLASQPILDRTQALVAYELLFRNASVGPARVTSDLSATTSVIAHTSQLDMEKVIGDSIGYSLNSSRNRLNHATAAWPILHSRSASSR